MQRLFIHARNANFHARDDGAEYAGPEAALAEGVRSAAAMIADEIGRGERNAAVEVIIERENGSQVLRSVVSMAVAPLMLADNVVPFPTTG